MLVGRYIFFPLTKYLTKYYLHQLQSTFANARMRYVIHDKPTVKIPLTFNRKESIVTLVTVIIPSFIVAEQHL